MLGGLLVLWRQLQEYAAGRSSNFAGWDADRPGEWLVQHAQLAGSDQRSRNDDEHAAVQFTVGQYGESAVADSGYFDSGNSGVGGHQPGDAGSSDSHSKQLDAHFGHDDDHHRCSSAGGPDSATAGPGTQLEQLVIAGAPAASRDRNQQLLELERSIATGAAAATGYDWSSDFHFEVHAAAAGQHSAAAGDDPRPVQDPGIAAGANARGID